MEVMKHFERKRGWQLATTCHCDVEIGAIPRGDVDRLHKHIGSVREVEQVRPGMGV